MNGRFKRAAPRASIGTIALAVLAIGATSGVASSSWAAAASTSPSASVLAPIHGRYNPDIDAANFVRRVDNPYFPLVPGTGFHFKGVSGTTPQADNAVVLHKTKRILGIDATVVRDEVSGARHCDRADLRPLRAGQAGQRLVRGRARTRPPARPPRQGERFVAGGGQRRQARHHHARPPAARRRLPTGVLPSQ